MKRFYGFMILCGLALSTLAGCGGETKPTGGGGGGGGDKGKTGEKK